MPVIILLSASVSFLLRVFVISLWSQFESVIGLQFFISLRSFPAFGRSFSIDSLCDWGRLFVIRLCLQESSSLLPKLGHVSFKKEYGMPSGPGALSVHFFRVFSRS